MQDDKHQRHNAYACQLPVCSTLAPQWAKHCKACSNKHLVCSKASLAPALVVAVVAVAELGKGADLRFQLALQLPGLPNMKRMLDCALSHFCTGQDSFRPTQMGQHPSGVLLISNECPHLSSIIFPCSALVRTSHFGAHGCAAGQATMPPDQCLQVTTVGNRKPQFTKNCYCSPASVCHCKVGTSGRLCCQR